jgi:hypothetical protein
MSRGSILELALVRSNHAETVSAYQVVSEELHDEGRVLVALLGKGVELYRLN